jgi:hypothetical protein
MQQMINKLMKSLLSTVLKEMQNSCRRGQLEQVEEVIDDADLHAANDQQADEEQPVEKPVEHRAEGDADQLEQVEEVIDDADLHAANDQQADEKPVEHRAEGEAEQLEQVEEVMHCSK